MLVIWDPEDGSEKQQWHFDPEDVTYKATTQIESHFGGTYDQWQAQLKMGSMKARAVLLWYMLCQVHPKLPFKDVPDFRVRQLKVEQSVAELLSLHERVQRMKLSEEDKERFELAFEVDLEDAMEREGLKGEPEIVDGQLALDGVVVVAPDGPLKDR